MKAHFIGSQEFCAHHSSCCNRPGAGQSETLLFGDSRCEIPEQTPCETRVLKSRSEDGGLPDFPPLRATL